MRKQKGHTHTHLPKEILRDSSESNPIFAMKVRLHCADQAPVETPGIHDRAERCVPKMKVGPDWKQLIM